MVDLHPPYEERTVPHHLPQKRGARQDARSRQIFSSSFKKRLPEKSFAVILTVNAALRRHTHAFGWVARNRWRVVVM